MVQLQHTSDSVLIGSCRKVGWAFDAFPGLLLLHLRRLGLIGMPEFPLLAGILKDSS